jgi:riboflavin kinase/FMN adenylyltransferase
MANASSTANARCDGPAWRTLREGRPEQIVRLPGTRRMIQAEVMHGDARGRTIGFPTANMHLDEDESLAFGVYAVRVRILDDAGWVTGRHDGVANFGIRPMFRVTQPLLEVHLFDFSGDLYGRDLVVEFVAWLRSEEKFGGLEALVTQIIADAATAKAVLRGTP